MTEVLNGVAGSRTFNAVQARKNFDDSKLSLKKISDRSGVSMTMIWRLTKIGDYDKEEIAALKKVAKVVAGKIRISQKKLAYCEICSSQLEGRQRLYCSKRCQRKGTQLKRAQKDLLGREDLVSQKAVKTYRLTCAYCAAPFYRQTASGRRPRVKYCSTICADAGRNIAKKLRDTPYRECPICMRQFRMESEGQRCCSDECRAKRARQIGLHEKKVANLEVNIHSKCRTCGELYKLSEDTYRYYCSAKCMERPEVDVCCVNCGERFTPNKFHKVTCSDKCRVEREQTYRNAHKAGSTIKCKRCSKRFVRVRAHQKYCSRDCRLNAQPADPLFGKCAVCDKTFQQRNHQNIYCSPECSAENVRRMRREKRRMKICIECGDRLPPYARKYCSEFCAERGAKALR